MGDKPGTELPPIEVGLLRPEDAPGVAELFRAVYGESYPVRDYYDPPTLIAANQEGRIISSVARTPEGRVVGHIALFNHVPHPHTHESGAALVHPDFRQANLLGRMGYHTVRVSGPRFGVEMVWVETVCNHVFSQRATQNVGLTTMALEVDLMPASAYAQERSASGRVSTILSFITLAPQPHTLHLPPRHAKAISDLYAEFDDRRHFAVAEADLPAGVVTRLDSRVYDSAQVARVAILEAGPDLEPALARIEDQASARGVVVFQAWVNLGQPWAGAVTEILRRRGYFLGGPLPRWFGSDGLLMQKLAHPPDWGNIKLAFDRANGILDLVRADYESLS
ncbi:MAG: hypothetical protein LDL07_08005 [Desulfarculus sp.]|nr:hypothetical protein [Desulfarculus sp.]